MSLEKSQIVARQSNTRKILMLVPHEPEIDPRIRWVTKLCKRVGNTEIIGFVYDTNDKPSHEFDGLIYTVRILPSDYPRSCLVWVLDTLRFFLHPREAVDKLIQKLWQLIYPLSSRTESGQKDADFLKSTKVKLAESDKRIIGGTNGEPKDKQKDIVNSGRSQPLTIDKEKKCSQVKKNQNDLIDYLRSIYHWLITLYTLELISNTLFQRARTSSNSPCVVICHDIYALQAAVKLKMLFGSPIIYDSHELWPEADLRSLPWEKKWIERTERKLIREADVVITVTPQIAAHLEKLYQIENVLSVPNAKPLPSKLKSASKPKDLEYPLRFLLQGQVTTGRGIEEFLDAWELVDDERTVLIVRCPDNPFVVCLRKKFQASVRKNRLMFAPPVRESELVQAASAADVGVIPYTGPNLNHIYACPNKLSQYMQAGLVIFHHFDQAFVTHVVNKYQCGISFDSSRPGTIKDAVACLVDNPDILKRFQENSLRAVITEFNWEMQSKPYLDALKRFYPG